VAICARERFRSRDSQLFEVKKSLETFVKANEQGLFSNEDLDKLKLLKALRSKLLLGKEMD